ncbi:hypothetical protein HNQ91_003950 [Filimonas zeae]|uniref:Uncharacterized protein n=1 Tax=Filimonas zeae TaxID=1737353 RepID=A0A917J2G1_9BACT|nr:hypothetical protein [Filimonas zeae]MDR6340877.1 hypothetical protein [Filimonas zeae]GGH78101.1 hypothetical protein GCM10011379_45470 [Filimonas zeae]
MSVKTVNQLKSLFKNGDKPNQQAFYDFMDSYRHVNDKIAGTDLNDELYNIISSMPPANAYNQLLAMVQTKATPADIVAAITAAGGSTLAPLSGGKVPVVYLPDSLGADAYMDQTFTTNIAVGGIAAGTVISSGTRLNTIVRNLLTTVYNPDITAPAFTLSHNATPYRKIDSTVNVLLTFNFDRGNVQSGWSNTSQGARAGDATGYTFMNADNVAYSGQPQAGNQYTVNNYTVLQGLNVFKSKVAYVAGIQPLNSNGDSFGSPLAAGESPVQSTSFEGVYPLLGTTAAITTATEQTLVSMLTATGIELNLVAESGGNKQTFWIPAVWLAARSLKSVQYFNTVSNTYDGANKAGDFLASDATVGGVSYKRYVNQTSDRGALKIRLAF